MIIAVDLDDVLSATTPAFIDYYNTIRKTDFRLEDFHTYYWHNIVGEARDDVFRLVHDFYFSPDFAPKPVIGAIEGIKKLAQSHSLHIVTSRQEEFADITHKWVNNHFPTLFQKVHIANHAHWATQGTSRTKKEICQEIGAEVLIEDNLDYIEECADLGIRSILLDRPWNKSKTPKSTTRAYSWNDIITNLA
ncbi:hypothetical protein KC726_03060 [Candidatus Woesebacteria bacterium]|nr:hypothetical protein [Candidatus Woesebacteria bacterium]